jgi:hypothetical protein
VIDFDFMEYSQLRWKQYYASVEDVLALVPQDCTAGPESSDF